MAATTEPPKDLNQNEAGGKRGRGSSVSTSSPKPRQKSGGGGHGQRQGQNRRGDPNTKRPLQAKDFLMGGNVRDPLNLAAIASPSPAASAAASPAASPPKGAAASPIAVRIPRSTKDPLNLSGQRRKRRRRDSRHGEEETTAGGATDEKRRSYDPIVSPVVPGPKGRRSWDAAGERRRTDGERRKGLLPQPLLAEEPRPTTSAQAPPKPEKTDKAKANQVRFRYGNYNQYYGTRLPEGTPDPRLAVLEAAWLTGKDVLDVGCNIGHLTAIVARDFGPARILGLDIDPDLVCIARKNVRRYLDLTAFPSTPDLSKAWSVGEEDLRRFPPSFAREFGAISVQLPNAAPLQAPGDAYRGRFPDNLAFATDNYVLLMDAELERVSAEFDVVLALSVSKWVHLNWGDAGLKRFFRRAFRALKPGGRLVLEPQPWDSYKKKMRNFTDAMKAHFHSIKLRPDDFADFLLKDVGFKSVHTLKEATEAKGFERPIYAFLKADKMPGHITFEDDEEEEENKTEKRKEADEEGKGKADEPSAKRAKPTD